MLARTQVISSSPRAVAWLVVVKGRNTGRDIRLGRINAIGREGMQNTIVLDDSAASALHAKIRLERGRFVLYDLGSTNGTFVNGRPAQKQTLMDGDEVAIGHTLFVFKEVRR
jgi:pSer/pThr/pTyr-binding forkhead associated (FHA) protein